MFVTFLLFQSNFYVILARGKGPQNSVHRDLFKTKNPKHKTLKPSDPQVCGEAFSLTHFPKCLKNVIFPKFLVIPCTKSLKPYIFNK